MNKGYGREATLLLIYAGPFLVEIVVSDIIQVSIDDYHSILSVKAKERRYCR